MTDPSQPHERVLKPRQRRGLGQRARWIAHAWGLAAIVTFAALAATVGIPRGLEGGLLEPTLEAWAQYGCFALAATGMLLAWRAPMTGGSIAAIAAVALGVLAGVQYKPYVALLVCLAFFIPATLELVSCMRGRHRRLHIVVGAYLVGLLVLGGVGAIQIHAASFGPTHPQSQLDAPDSELVEWVWSGAITENGATVRAKLERRAGDVQLKLTAADETDRVALVEPAGGGRSPQGVVTFVATGLEPATEYRYVIELNGVPELGHEGRFTTFSRTPHSFTVAVGACARVGSNGLVFDAIRGHEPALYVITGDLYYADIDSNDPGRFRDQFDEALTRPAQAALYRSTPIAYVWDDHDYGPDNADKTAASREAARAVYREVVPHYELPAGSGNAAIYQAFSIGRVRFILTDARSERDPPPGEDEGPRSMLGSAQKAWLEQELLAANGSFPVIVWVNSVPWIGEPKPGGDSWQGFAEERREIADFIADNAIEGIVMVSGDAHMVAIDDGSHSDYSSDGGAAFPVLHAAALDRRGSTKGGPYSSGAYPGSGQFGLVTVEDDGGDTVVVSLTGLNWKGEEIVSHRIELPAHVVVGDGDR